jgi:MFS family permease
LSDQAHSDPEERRRKDPADRGRVTALGVLKEQNFRRFFIGQSTSLLGDGMVGVALAFAVLDLTGSPADLGYVLAARSIPLVAVLLVGGVIADRFPRRRIMVTADVARFLGQATSPTCSSRCSWSSARRSANTPSAAPPRGPPS